MSLGTLPPASRVPIPTLALPLGLRRHKAEARASSPQHGHSWARLGLLVPRCLWVKEAVDPWREQQFCSCRALFVRLCGDSKAAGCLGGWEGALALPQPRLLSPAMGLILSRLHKLGNSLKCRSAALQKQTSQQPFAAEGRDSDGIWITGFYPQNELKHDPKL